MLLALLTPTTCQPRLLQTFSINDLLVSFSLKMGKPGLHSISFRSFHNANTNVAQKLLQIIKVYMVYLGLEPRAAKWNEQIKPLRNGSTPLGYFCLFRFDVCVFVTSFSLIEWNSFFVVFELQFCFAHKLLFYLLCQGQKNKQQTNVKGWQTIGPVTTRRMGWGIYLKQL